MIEQDDVASMTASVENLGGIGSCQLTLDRGVTVLTGLNATNRTSFLRAIGAGLGGSSGELRADADAGSVTLDIGGEEFTRTFERDGDAVRVGGDPYTEEIGVVDRYSCILADNPARTAVERGDSDALREFIMAPVDTDEIRAEIERTQRAIRTLQDELEEARGRADRRASLERRLDDHREDLADVRSELETLREEVSAFEADVDDAEAAEAVVEELADAREEYERVQSRLETQRSALDSLREEREAVTDELAETSAPEDERDRLRDELDRLQRRERELENTVTNLLSIVEFNEELLDDEAVPGVGDATEDRTEGLDPTTRTVECWTCGTRVERDAIDDRLDALRDVVDEKRRERNELRTEIDEIRSELQDAKSAVQERAALEDQLADIDAERDERESRIAEFEERSSDLEERIERLEAAAAESDGLRDSDLLEKYQRLSELQYERGQLEEQIDSLESDLERAESAVDRVEELEAELAERRETLEAARTRVADLERNAVETFNEHMATVRELLGYENVERVWIERKSGSGPGSTSGGVSSSTAAAAGTFELHVVRATPDDAVYEDTVDHLSESEREVIGLVVALAGYLVHDVHEQVPVMVLDSLEAIDSDRIAALVEYVAEFVPFLVVALLPEDAAALPDRYDRIQMGEARA